MVVAVCMGHAQSLWLGLLESTTYSLSPSRIRVSMPTAKRNTSFMDGIWASPVGSKAAGKSRTNLDVLKNFWQCSSKFSGAPHPQNVFLAICFGKLNLDLVLNCLKQFVINFIGQKFTGSHHFHHSNPVVPRRLPKAAEELAPIREAWLFAFFHSPKKISNKKPNTGIYTENVG